MNFLQVTIVMYLIPVVVMTLCYSMILVKLFCRTQPGEHPTGGHHDVPDPVSGDDDPLLLHDSSQALLQDTAR
jgi:hypothetical protein